MYLSDDARSQSKVYKIEAALVGAKPRDVTDLLDIYGVDEIGDRGRLTDRVRAASEPGWWRKYRDVISAQYSECIGLETEACQLQTYQPMVVPGLFQTEAYARALAIGVSPDEQEERFERQVAVRLARQSRLFESDPLRVWAVINEEVFAHVVGDLNVMREQVEWLFKLIELPNVNLQILRTHRGAHPGVPMPEWRKSTFSTPNQECVEVARGVEVVGVRDSKSPGPILTVTPTAWTTLLAALHRVRI